MKLFALNPSETIKKPLSIQKDEKPEDQIIFEFKKLTVPELAELEELLAQISEAGSDTTGTEENPFTLGSLVKPMSKALDIIVLGWENLKDVHGTEYKFEDYKHKKLELLDLNTVVEILSDSLKHNTLTKEQEGN